MKRKKRKVSLFKNEREIMIRVFFIGLITIRALIDAEEDDEDEDEDEDEWELVSEAILERALQEDEV